MRNFIIGLVIGIIICFLGIFIHLFIIGQRCEVEGIYIAYPPLLSTSMDFRDNGTMFMVAGSSAEWFNWKRDGDIIYATGTSEKYNEKTIEVKIANCDLFLQNIRLIKQ